MSNQELERALQKLIVEIKKGIAHGFFECAVSCQIVQGGKRRLTITAGKSYQFTISEDEFKSFDEQ